MMSNSMVKLQAEHDQHDDEHDDEAEDEEGDAVADVAASRQSNCLQKKKREKIAIDCSG